MKLVYGDYSLCFCDGGLEVRKNNVLLYFNRRPMFVTVKTAFAVSEFYDRAYDEVSAFDDIVIAKGTLSVPSGSEFYFSDVYELCESGFKVKRNVKLVSSLCMI